MKHNIYYQSMETTHKLSNPNFYQQLCTFLSQSKQQKQQQFLEINQYMIEQFIHLFQICNINRYIDYTEEFMNEIRNIILRLQIVQKNKFECFDEKDEFMYLLVEGKVQKTHRQKPIPFRRASKFNMTVFNLQAISLMSTFDTKSSSQTLNNIQLRDFEKSVIMNRSKRMSIATGNLWNQMISSPRKKQSNQRKSNRNSGSFSSKHTKRNSSFNKTKLNQFKEKFNEKQQSSFDGQNITDHQLHYKAQLLEPLENQIYHCLTSVKYIKLLKWSYDQLVQYVFKYQNDRLIKFLSKTLKITESQIKFHQIHNKTVFNFYKQRESSHSKVFVSFNPESLYILRKGSVELKYQCSFSAIQLETNAKNFFQPNKNPNLAEYINQSQICYKKIVLNEGAIVCPQLQKESFYVQSLEDVVFIEVKCKILEYLKFESKGSWWKYDFLPIYKKIKEDRSHYMKDQEVYLKQSTIEVKLNNVCLQTKNRKLHSAKNSQARFRTEIKGNNIKENLLEQSTIEISKDKENVHENFASDEHKLFMSLLPYQIVIKSKEQISMKLNEKSIAKHKSNKVFNYLKQNQKEISSAKYKDKVLKLKMKNIAAKQMNVKDLNSIYKDINQNSVKKQFHKSLKGNWFNEQTEFASEETITENFNQDLNKNSNGFHEKRVQKKELISCNFNNQITLLSKKNNVLNNNVVRNSSEFSQNEQKKVTFDFKAEIDSQEQEFLCSDDTGLIRKFVKNSHNYQKQISFLINSSKRQDRSLFHKKKNIQRCKTEGNNLLSSCSFIKNIMKRIKNTDVIAKIFPGKDSKNLSNNIQNPLQNQTISKNDLQNEDSDIKNQSNIFSETFSKIQNKNAQISEIKGGNHQINREHNKHMLCSFKNKKTGSFTNYSSSKHSSSKFLKSNNQLSNTMMSVNNKRAFTPFRDNDKRESYAQSVFFKQSIQRPSTAQIAPRIQCKSLFFNQWIETQPSQDQYNEHRIDHRNSELGAGSYNFFQRNISSGDKKVWKRLKSGKIVKKSVNFCNNQKTHFQLTGGQRPSHAF